jgi:hypothetical protein
VSADELHQISKPSAKEAREARERAESTPEVERPALPHTVGLPTRYYSRLAIEAVARDFAELATVESKVGDGVIDVTFNKVDFEAGDVIAEFLNHALYRSAVAAEEANR